MDGIVALILIGLGLAVVGSGLGVARYRKFSPSSFDRNAVLLIVKIFSAIGAGTVLLGLLMKKSGS